MLNRQNIAVIIPARLASTRFPGKPLQKVSSIPMVEYVRRRVMLSSVASQVYVATCDEEIAQTICDNGGKVLITSNQHKNGTTRAAEAVRYIDDCTHVIIVQGDEPLVLPRHVDAMVGAINNSPEIDSWNLTSEISKIEEVDDISSVKCVLTRTSDILYCFRRNPCIGDFELQRQYLRKIQGIMGFRREALRSISEANCTTAELGESIEQLRIIEYGFEFKSICVEPSLTSVNYPEEIDYVNKYILTNEEQREMNQRVLEYISHS